MAVSACKEKRKTVKKRLKNRPENGLKRGVF